MVTAQTVVAALAMAASSMTVASAGTCSNTMMNASFNRYTSGSFTQWTRAGAEQEFPTGLRCPPRSPCFVIFLSIFPSSQYLVSSLLRSTSTSVVQWHSALLGCLGSTTVPTEAKYVH